MEGEWGEGEGEKRGEETHRQKGAGQGGEVDEVSLM